MAEQKLQGKTVAILATDGVEQVELVEPRKALDEAGATTELVSLKTDPIQGFNHLDHGDEFTPDKAVADASASDYDALMLPGGVANPDFLRMDEDAMRFVADFAAQKKPIAAICHAPWSLVETGIVKGRTVTSWPSLKTDITNAAARGSTRRSSSTRA
jgi:protease I